MTDLQTSTGESRALAKPRGVNAIQWVNRGLFRAYFFSVDCFIWFASMGDEDPVTFEDVEKNPLLFVGALASWVLFMPVFFLSVAVITPLALIGVGTQRLLKANRTLLFGQKEDE